MRVLFLTFLLLLVACAAPPVEEDLPLVLRPADFSDLPGWEKDEQGRALGAILRSCARIMQKDASQPFGKLEQAGTYGDWQEPCGKALALDQNDSAAVRGFLETYFQPWEARAGSRKEGLFTGYYEASLKGSRTRHGPYQTPLHARPDDLVMVDLGEFRDELKGQRIAGRVRGGNLKPYESRPEIIAGNWPHHDKVLVWVDSPVDAFFVQIQGSGVVELDNGQIMRIGYSGQNGHPYYAIGRELIERGHLDKDDVSMQSIRVWLEANPVEGAEIMNTNKSYVFFTELTGEGPLGAEGVALTPARSLAVDRTKIPYGVPLWVDIEPPAENYPPIRRLMVAQDTGGAIKGAVRGDFFWGYGEKAEFFAGQMKSKGRYWLLLPKAGLIQ